MLWRAQPFARALRGPTSSVGRFCLLAPRLPTGGVARQPSVYGPVWRVRPIRPTVRRPWRTRAMCGLIVFRANSSLIIDGAVNCLVFWLFFNDGRHSCFPCRIFSSPRRVPSAVGNSNPVAAGCARPARSGTSPRFLVDQVGYPFTGWFHSELKANGVSFPWPIGCSCLLQESPPTRYPKPATPVKHGNISLRYLRLVQPGEPPRVRPKC